MKENILENIDLRELGKELNWEKNSSQPEQGAA